LGEEILEAQGYPLNENVFYQDNQSTIKFEKNSRKSCGPKSRHIDIWYFFMKNCLDLEHIDVKHCPTEQMLADFFTKPLQGSLFRKFRDVIMGHKHIDSLKETVPTPSQERVGEDNILDNVRNGANKRRADTSDRKPVKNTYANITRKGVQRKPLESVRKALLSLSRINPIVRTV
jgi:hypothetical protein